MAKRNAELENTVMAFIQDMRQKCICLLNGLCLCYKEGTIPSTDELALVGVPKESQEAFQEELSIIDHPWNVENKERIIKEYPIWKQWFDKPQKYPAYYMNRGLLGRPMTKEEEKLFWDWFHNVHMKEREGLNPPKAAGE